MLDLIPILYELKFGQISKFVAGDGFCSARTSRYIGKFSLPESIHARHFGSFGHLCSRFRVPKISARHCILIIKIKVRYYRFQYNPTLILVLKKNSVLIIGFYLWLVKVTIPIMGHWLLINEQKVENKISLQFRCFFSRKWDAMHCCWCRIQSKEIWKARRASVKGMDSWKFNGCFCNYWQNYSY